MTGLPGLRVRVVVKGLTKLGFEKVTQKGSHAIFHNSDCRWSMLIQRPDSETEVLLNGGKVKFYKQKLG
jgi:predicted RNA binding protein YcfA (HicA-like mRNA interferase family)